MEQQFLISDLEYEEHTVRASSEKETKRIFEIASKLGYVWYGGESLVTRRTNWSPRHGGTLYFFDKRGKRVTYSNSNLSDNKLVIDSKQIVESKSINIQKTNTTMKEQITLFRRGFFVTKNFTPTQCTTEGHEAYTYMATLRCGYQLDEQGFLIDHTLLHKAIVEYIKDKPMLSCEVMSKQLAHLVVDSAKGHGCALKEIDFTIIPVGKGQIQRDIEGNWIAKNPMTIDYNKPANAIYNLIIDEEYQSTLTDEDRTKFIENAITSKLVTPDNAFVGMRVVKGEGWATSNYTLNDGEIGTITKVRGGKDKVEVKWDNQGEIDSYYDIGREKSELNISSDSPNKEEYEKNNPPLNYANKSNIEIGTRVVKEDDQSGDVGTIIRENGRFPENRSSDYVRVLWDKEGLDSTTYDIEDESDLVIAPEGK